MRPVTALSDARPTRPCPYLPFAFGLLPLPSTLTQKWLQITLTMARFLCIGLMAITSLVALFTGPYTVRLPPLPFSPSLSLPATD